MPKFIVYGKPNHPNVSEDERFKAVAEALPPGMAAVVFTNLDEIVLMPQDGQARTTTSDSPEGRVYVAASLFRPEVQPLLDLFLEMLGTLMPGAFKKVKIPKAKETMQ